MHRSTFTVTSFDSMTKAVFSQAMELGFGQAAVDPLPPGNIYVDDRERGGRYAVWRRMAADGKSQPPAYLGLDGGAGHEAAKARLSELKRIERTAKNLRKLGFASEDNPSAITLAALANAGVFNAGVVMVGTRALNCIANHLGYRVPNVATQDVDLASPRSIALAAPVPGGGVFGVLKGTGMNFVEIPGLKHDAPATSWRVVGKEIKVDLLVSARTQDEAYKSIPVPALGAHASALQTLDFLLPDAASGLVIGKSQLVPVRVPSAARFCWHKIAVAVLREQHMRNKAEKDLQQAGAMAVCMFESGDMSELIEAGQSMPKRMRGFVKKSFPKFIAQFGDDYRHVVEAMAHSQGFESMLKQASSAAAQVRRKT